MICQKKFSSNQPLGRMFPQQVINCRLTAAAQVE